MKYLILAIALFVSTTSLQAQDYTSQTVEELTILKSALQITDVQYHRIALGLEQNQKMKLKLEETFATSSSVKDAHLKELHQNKVKNIKGGLTAVQRDEFDRLELDEKL